MTMRLSLGHIDEYDGRVATFARQLGLRGVQLHTPNLLPGEHGYWSLAELRALRERCDADGLAIDGLENVPLAHFWKVQRGLPSSPGGTADRADQRRPDVGQPPVLPRRGAAGRRGTGRPARPAPG